MYISQDPRPSRRARGPMFLMKKFISVFTSERDGAAITQHTT